jgi:hypothetical protein
VQPRSAFVRFWTIADKVGLWPGAPCPLMTQSGHCDNSGRATFRTRVHLAMSALVISVTFRSAKVTAALPNNSTFEDIEP